MMKVTALVGQEAMEEEPKLFTNVNKVRTRTHSTLAGHTTLTHINEQMPSPGGMDFKFEVGTTMENPALRNLRPRRRAHSAPPANINTAMQHTHSVPLQTQTYQPMDVAQEDFSFRTRKRRRPMSESYSKLELGQASKDASTWHGRAGYSRHHSVSGAMAYEHAKPTFANGFSTSGEKMGALETGEPKIRKVVVNNTNPIRDGHGYPIEVFLTHAIFSLGNPTISEIKHIYHERDAVVVADDPGVSYVILSLNGLKLQPSNVFSIQEIDVKEACLIRLKVKFTCRPRAFLKNFPNGSYVKMAVTLMYPDNGRWKKMVFHDASFRFNPNNCKPKNGRFCHISPNKYVSEDDDKTFIIGENLAKDLQVFFGNLRCEVLPAQESRSYSCWRGIKIPPMEAVLKANQGSEYLQASGNGEFRVRVRVLQKAKSKFVNVEGEQYFVYKPWQGAVNLQHVTRQMSNFNMAPQQYSQGRMPMPMPHAMPPLQEHAMPPIQEEDNDHSTNHYLAGYPGQAAMDAQRQPLAPMPQYAHPSAMESFIQNDQSTFAHGAVGAVSYGY